MESKNIKDINKNRKAYFNYQILEKIESGICLKGTEIKSLRTKGCNINESFVQIVKNQAYLLKMEIPVYEFGNILNHEPFRKRKLLLHKKEIYHLETEIERKNLSVIPLKVYLKNGLAKILLGIGKGKKLGDKRDAIKKRITDKEIRREIKKMNYK